MHRNHILANHLMDFQRANCRDTKFYWSLSWDNCHVVLRIPTLKFSYSLVWNYRKRLSQNVNRQLYLTYLNKPVYLFGKTYRIIYQTNLRVDFISTRCSSRGCNNRCNQYDCSHTLFFRCLNSILAKGRVGVGGHT